MDEFLYALYTQSIFSGMEQDTILDHPHILPFIRGLSKIILDMLVGLLNSCQYLLDSAWSFLQFANFEKLIGKSGETNTASAGLYLLFNSGIWIGLIVSSIIAIFVLMFKQNGLETIRKFFSNIVVLAVVLLILPSVFSVINNDIFGDKAFLTADANNTSSAIVYRHTTDYLYCYNKYLKKYFKSDGSELKYSSSTEVAKLMSKLKAESNVFKKNNAGDYALAKKNIYSDVLDANTYKSKDKQKIINEFKKIDIRNVDLNTTITGDSVPKLFKQHAIEVTGDEGFSDLLQKQLLGFSAGSLTDSFNTIRKGISSKFIKVEDLFDGVFGFGASHYYRYRTDYLCCYIELIANIFLYVGAAFALIKLTWELMINRAIVGLVGSIDLTNGEKLRTILTSILGVYFSFAFVGLTFKLYSGACTFLQQNLQVSNLAYVILVLFLALVALDGPNIVGKIFGVNVGMRGGATMLAAGLAAGYTVGRGATRAAQNTAIGRNALGAGLHRFAKNSPVRAENRATRKAEKSARKAAEAQRVAEAQKKANALPKNAPLSDYKDRVKNEHGAMGQPISDNDLNRAATVNKANSNKDDLLNDAAYRKASAEANGKRVPNAQDSLSNLMKNNGGYDNKYIADAAANINTNNGVDGRTKENLGKIGSDAQSLIENSGYKYTGNEFQAYKDSVKGTYPQAKRPTAQEYIAKQAYAMDNLSQISAQANAYASSTSNRTIANESDYEHVLKNNSEYGVLPGASFNDNEAHNIAQQLRAERGSAKNLGASAF